MTTWRLVRAFAWRFRWSAVLAVPVAISVWLSAHYAADDRAFPPVVILAVGAVAQAFTVLWSRETRLLPITRVDLWRLTWLAAVVVPVANLSVIRLFVVELEAVGFNAVLEFVYLGIPVAALPRLMAGGASAKRAERTVIYAVLPVLLMWLALPFLISPVPATFAAVPSWGRVVLGIGVLVAAASFLWTPRTIGRCTYAVSHAKPGRRHRAAVLDGVSGLSRLVPGQIGSAVAVCAFVITIELLPLVFFDEPRSGVELLEASGLLLFRPDQTELQVLRDCGITLFLAATLSAYWSDWLRQLRYLPLRTGQINALLLSGPVVAAAVLWLVLAAMHVGVFGAVPVVFRPGLFLFVCGIGSFSNALKTRLGVSGYAIAYLGMGVAFGLLAARYQTGGATGAVATLGAVTMIAAGWLNFRTLTCASSHSPTYRTIAQMFNPDGAGVTR